MQWEQVREMGEVEMEDFIKEWCDDVKAMQHVDIERTWSRYRMRAVKVQEAKVGRKAVRSRKCQGKWYDVFDLELQNLKKEAGRVLHTLKRQRRMSQDVADLYTRYREIRKAAKCRLRVVIKAQAVSMVKEVERLKDSDAKAGWRALKKMIGMQAVKSANLSKVLDPKGRECSGDTVKNEGHSPLAESGENAEMSR